MLASSKLPNEDIFTASPEVSASEIRVGNTACHELFRGPCAT